MGVGCSVCGAPKSSPVTESSTLLMQPPQILKPVGIPAWVALLVIFAWYALSATFYVVSEKWTLRDTMYFLSATITTVGYGDVVPTTDGAKLFTIFIIISMIVIISSMIGSLLISLSNAANAFASKNETDHHVTHVRRLKQKVAVASVVVVVVVCVGAVFVHCADSYDWLDSFYWAVVTSSGVGYGDLALGSASRIFCVFFLPISVLSVGYAAGQLISLMLQMETARRVNLFISRGVTPEMIREMDWNNSGEIDKFEFVTYMLQGEGKIDKADVQRHLELFMKFDTDGSGTIDTADILKTSTVDPITALALSGAKANAKAGGKAGEV